MTHAWIAVIATSIIITQATILQSNLHAYSIESIVGHWLSASESAVCRFYYFYVREHSFIAEVLCAVRPNCRINWAFHSSANQLILLVCSYASSRLTNFDNKTAHLAQSSLTMSLNYWNLTQATVWEAPGEGQVLNFLRFSQFGFLAQVVSESKLLLL